MAWAGRVGCVRTFGVTKRELSNPSTTSGVRVWQLAFQLSLYPTCTGAGWHGLGGARCPAWRVGFK